MKRILLIAFVILLSVPAFSQTSWNSSFNEKEKIESELKVYPNPCKNSKVIVDFNSKEIKEIKISNITGKQVLLKKYSMPVRKTQLQLNSIPNGIYLLQVKTNENKIVVKKLMVSKK
ncbi:MAG: T9SS type A sorting domain-containing protein [Draconibacterium sp.]|nr:T9SS type A sorting domain-containing protein [Draconibacterium sp.]